MTEHVEKLRRLGEKYQAADAAREAALAELAEAMREADGTVNVKLMSELGGVSRVTVYRLIGRTNVK